MSEWPPYVYCRICGTQVRMGINVRDKHHLVIDYELTEFGTFEPPATARPERRHIVIVEGPPEPAPYPLPKPRPTRPPVQREPLFPSPPRAKSNAQLEWETSELKRRVQTLERLVNELMDANRTRAERSGAQRDYAEFMDGVGWTKRIDHVA